MNQNLALLIGASQIKHYSQKALKEEQKSNEGN